MLRWFRIIIYNRRKMQGLLLERRYPIVITKLSSTGSGRSGKEGVLFGLTIALESDMPSEICGGIGRSEA